MARPEISKTPLSERLRELRGEIDRGDWAESLGVSKTTIANYERGDRVPDGAFLQKLAAKGINMQWLLTGDTGYGHQLRPKTLEEIKAERPARRAAASKATNVIPNLMIHAGMGNGGLEAVEIDAAGVPLEGFTDGDWSFPASVSKRLGRFAGLYALTVEGDSMEPNYKGGSTVFVDTRRITPSPPGVFAVDYGDGLLVKRIELIGGTEKIAVMSDNTLYRGYEFHRNDVKIWGRVRAKWEWVD